MYQCNPNIEKEIENFNNKFNTLCKELQLFLDKYTKKEYENSSKLRFLVHNECDSKKQELIDYVNANYKSEDILLINGRGSNTINSALNFKIRSLLHDKNDEFQKLCYDHFQ
ncbi:hypothetical protein [Flavobacterium commune]|uniref:Uncharacterized protein n=1 Tax=Flavobacterium commune TaxID=1306519 RepID=A0A1D9P728_9FLAO|nr:hypothetical protein [Flavobacterium commune]AOZ98416.1 hypothetical protein BIW12_02645 [Flavobacterium commune]